MTGRELLLSAISLMHETDAAVYEAFAVPLLNLVLAETFEINNRVREKKGKAPLKDIPLLEKLGEAVPHEEELCRLALPFGVVARIYADEGNNPMLSMYKQEYANYLNAGDRLVLEL